MTDDLLRALGCQQRAEFDDPATGEADELGAPFDADERDALLDAVFERVDASAAKPEPAAATPQPADPSNVVALASRRRAIAVGTLLSLAAAAGLVWWVMPAPDGDELLATVPAYSFSRLDGGIVATRAEPHAPAPDAELELRASSTIDWVLTPSEPTRDPVALALLAESQHGESDDRQRSFVARLDGVEVSDSGALRLRGPLDRWVALTPGAWRLTLFVAAPAGLPRDAAAAAKPGSWRALELRVTIVAAE